MNRDFSGISRRILKDLGNVWEMFGKCLEHSYPDYQAFNIVFWEMFGKCLGNVWEMFGNLRGGGENEKKMKKSVKMFFSTDKVFIFVLKKLK